MKTLLSLLIICCAFASTKAQVNFVENPGFEKDSLCPIEDSKIYYAKHWGNAVDKYAWGGAESFNICANIIPGGEVLGIPNNALFYGYPHCGEGLAGSGMFYDKSSPPPPLGVPLNVREYIQGQLYKNLINGKVYCLSFWVALAQSSGYAHNKIGLYIDNGDVNFTVDSANKEILSIKPQIYSDTVLKDTMKWTKIEGTYIATGNESIITIGNFFPNDSVSTIVTNYWSMLPQYSYYLIDDVSVVAIDAKANAGVDRWVELSKKTQIGPVEDSTARGMDCKWYHKGVLIDSGNVISVSASSIKYAVDTYVVVQNVCGSITRDTMLLRTVGLGMSPSPTERAGERFSIYPNPSTGAFTIASLRGTKQSETIKVYNFLAQVIYEGKLKDKKTTIQLNAASGVYIIEVTDENQNRWRERVVVE